MNPVKQTLELAKENNELKAKLEALETASAAATKEQSPEVLQAAIAAAVGPAINALAQSVSALGEEIKAIKAEKADFQAEVGKSAALVVAGITGHRPPLKLSEGDPVTVAVFDQYTEIKKTDPIGAARFWREHRAELRRVA